MAGILNKPISDIKLLDILELMANSESTQATLTLDGFSVKITICSEEEEDNDD